MGRSEQGGRETTSGTGSLVRMAMAYTRHACQLTQILIFPLPSSETINKLYLGWKTQILPNKIQSNHVGMPFSNRPCYSLVSVHAKSISRVWLFVTLQTTTRQVPPSMGFSRQEYRSVLPFPPPGNLHNPETKPASPVSPALASEFFTTSATWEVQSLVGVSDKRTDKTPSVRYPWIFKSLRIWWEDGFELTVSLPF